MDVDEDPADNICILTFNVSNGWPTNIPALPAMPPAINSCSANEGEDSGGAICSFPWSEWMQSDLVACRASVGRTSSMLALLDGWLRLFEVRLRCCVEEQI